MSTIERVLSEKFKLSGFRPGQREVIERLVARKNVAAVFPTGGGKSLCYQLPSLLFDGLTVVVSPLMALMREQVDTLLKLGIPAGRLDSSLTPDELRSTTQGLRNKSVKILYVAPERFFNERFREMIATIPISLFAVDEAHCISQWGHNFRPDYLKLASIAESLRAERILALTATATPAVLDDIRSGFHIAEEDAIRTPFHRKNLALRFTSTDAPSRFELLRKRLATRERGSTIVYVTLQKTSEEVAEKLATAGFDARAYHAGMDDQVRRDVQDWFMSTENAIVVATIAFGMGIDKSDIRYIYHWNISKGLESYAQEIGRAGRDGLSGLCETFVVPEDRVVLENFAYGDTPTLPSISKFVDFVAHQPERFYVSYYSLANECDIRDLVVRTLMTYLELDGYLEAAGPRYDKYEFKPLVGSASILKHFEGEQRQFASDVLSLCVKRKTWFELPLPVVAERLKCDRARIVKMIDYFGEQGWMELKVSGLVHGYRRAKQMTDLDSIKSSLHRRLEELEANDIRRIDRLFQMAYADQCQAGVLAEYFGQPIVESCGQCSVCIAEPAKPIEGVVRRRIGSSALTQLSVLTKERPEIWEDPRLRCRFLCGLSSPKLIRYRLTGHPLYGCCSEVPFADVLNAMNP